jgi:hypothetical protein
VSDEFVQQFKPLEIAGEIKTILTERLTEEDLRASLAHFDDAIARKVYPEFRRAAALETQTVHQAMGNVGLPEPSLKRLALVKHYVDRSGIVQQVVDYRLLWILRTLGVSIPTAEPVTGKKIDLLRAELQEATAAQLTSVALLSMRNIEDAEVEVFVNQATLPSVVKVGLTLAAARGEVLDRRSLPPLLDLVRIGTRVQPEPLVAPKASATSDEIAAVVLVPLLGFPEDFAHDLAKLLGEHLRIPVKASLQLGDIGNFPFKRNPAQASADAIIEAATPLVRRLPNLDAGTYVVLLTKQDINSERVQANSLLAWHHHVPRISLVSIAGLFPAEPMKAPLRNPLFDRTYKMIKRAIGEHHLGWRRSNNPLDLMFSPIGPVTDLDRLSIDHRPQSIMLQSPTPANR